MAGRPAGDGANEVGEGRGDREEQHPQVQSLGPWRNWQTQGT